MADRETQDEQFNKETYNYDYAKRSGWNVQNAQVTRGPMNNGSTTIRENESPTSRFAKNTRSHNNTASETPVASSLAPTRIPNPTKKVQSEQAESVAVSKMSQMNAGALKYWLASWTIFWWATIQIPASIVFAIMFSASFIVSDGWYDTINKVIQTVTEFLDLPSIDLNVLMFIAGGASFVIGIMNLGVCWIIYSLASIPSINGTRGTGSKQGTFLLAIVGSLPLFSFFPCTCIWIWTVTKFPE